MAATALPDSLSVVAAHDGLHFFMSPHQSLDRRRAVAAWQRWWRAFLLLRCGACRAGSDDGTGHRYGAFSIGVCFRWVDFLPPGLRDPYNRFLAVKNRLLLFVSWTYSYKFFFIATSGFCVRFPGRLWSLYQAPLRTLIQRS